MEMNNQVRKGSILVVDDSTFMARLMTQMLEGTEYRVVAHAKDGRDAIQKYIEMYPEIVTMDILMPNMGGLDAIRELVKIDPRIKLIVASAVGHDRVIEEAMTLGAFKYLVKPFLKQSFLDALSAVSSAAVQESHETQSPSTAP